MPKPILISNLRGEFYDFLNKRGWTLSPYSERKFKTTLISNQSLHRLIYFIEGQESQCTRCRRSCDRKIFKLSFTRTDPSDVKFIRCPRFLRGSIPTSEYEIQRSVPTSEYEMFQHLNHVLGTVYHSHDIYTQESSDAQSHTTRTF
jgi:hypothetical protein